jgi:hypothetical protein
MYYIETLKLFLSIFGGRGGVKGKFFNIEISLVGYNFELILSPNFDRRWDDAIQNIRIFHVVFRSSFLIQSTGGFQSKIQRD